MSTALVYMNANLNTYDGLFKSGSLVQTVAARTHNDTK